MNDDFKEKSMKFFISIMKVAMGILGVFSICYIVTAVGLIDFDEILPSSNSEKVLSNTNETIESSETTIETITNNTDENALTSKSDLQIAAEETVEAIEEETKEKEETNTFDKLDSYLKDYSNWLDEYFNKGFYYDFSKQNSSSENDEKQDSEESDEKSDLNEKEDNDSSSHYQTPYTFRNDFSTYSYEF